jgi:hypothetical protein
VLDALLDQETKSETVQQNAKIPSSSKFVNDAVSLCVLKESRAKEAGLTPVMSF